MLELRFDGETREDFRQRVERTAHMARVLVVACLENVCMCGYLDDPRLPMITLQSITRNPTVRVEYEQAIALGGIGETLAMTRGKHWGAGPSVLPLARDDCFFPDRITYLYRDCVA